MPRVWSCIGYRHSSPLAGHTLDAGKVSLFGQALIAGCMMLIAPVVVVMVTIVLIAGDYSVGFKVGLLTLVWVHVLVFYMMWRDRKR